MLTAHRAAVLGSPIRHSLSPALHRAAYAALGLDSWSYSAHDVTEDRLTTLLASVGPEWAGLSLTMPLKEAALTAADEASDLARQVGAANTLVRLPDGGWFAHNTDVYGVEAALRGAGLAGVRSAVVVGSGATARAVLSALAGLGCSRATFIVRDRARPETLALTAAAGVEALVCRADEAAGPVAGADVLVSTTPTGVDVPLALPTRWTGAPPVALDVVYAGWPTPLAAALDARGATVVSGFEMLLHQAARQVELMTGLGAPVEAMRAAGLAAMAQLTAR